MTAPELPPRALAQRQSEALAGMRARLLRRIGVAHRGPVLDLGAGWGDVTAELVRRARGPVVGLDRHPEALAALGPLGVAGEAAHLPFDAGHFDLVVAQLVLLWQPDLRSVLREVRRVLAPGGALLALEPDYGGMLEHPPEIAVADLWQAALRRAGADPRVGRRVPVELARLGFEVRVDLFPAPGPADPGRFERLAGLPLEPPERERLDAARRADAALPSERKMVHLPFVCTTALRR